MPTGVVVMQSGQIGRPQFEQETPVSREGWRYQVAMGRREPIWARTLASLLDPLRALAVAEQPAGLAAEIADHALGALAGATDRAGRGMRTPPGT